MTLKEKNELLGLKSYCKSKNDLFSFYTDESERPQISK